MEEEKKERIKTWMAACLIIVALCVDGLQALLTALGFGLILGPIISICAYLVFWIWFKILGVSFVTNWKKLMTMGSSGVVEATISFVPAFSVAITTVVFMTMAEDKNGIIGKAAGLAQGKIKM